MTLVLRSLYIQNNLNYSSGQLKNFLIYKQANNDEINFLTLKNHVIIIYNN